MNTAPSEVVKLKKCLATFLIPGEPVAQGRGKVVRFGSRAGIKDPEKSAAWKRSAAVYAEQGMRRAGLKTGTEPVGVVVYAIWPLPKGQARKRNPRGMAMRAKKPDVDNVAKAVLDACNGVLYEDDAQVVKLEATKLTAAQGRDPCVIVELWSVEGER